MSDQEINDIVQEPRDVTVSPKPTPPVRQPKVELTLVDKDSGEHHKITGRYPMPVKAKRFNLIINGELCEAAHTSGRGLDYTHFQFNKTGFFILGTFQPESDLGFIYPEGYLFDTEVKPRPSWVKRQEVKMAKESNPEWQAKQAEREAAKAAKAEAAAALSAAKEARAVETPTDTPSDPASVPSEPAVEGVKAKRRGK